MGGSVTIELGILLGSCLAKDGSSVGRTNGEALGDKDGISDGRTEALVDGEVEGSMLKTSNPAIASIISTKSSSCSICSSRTSFSSSICVVKSVLRFQKLAAVKRP